MKQVLLTFALASTMVLASGGFAKAQNCQDPRYLSTYARAEARSEHDLERALNSRSCADIARLKADVIAGNVQIDAVLAASATCHPSSHVGGVEQADRLWQQFCTGSAARTRVAVAKPAPRIAAAQPTPRLTSAIGDNYSCSTITGLPGGDPSQSCGIQGRTYAALASKSKGWDPVATRNYYRAAAEAYRRAKMFAEMEKMQQALADFMASLPSNSRKVSFSHLAAPPTCSGLADNQLVLTNSRRSPLGWYTYKLKNIAQCTICFTFKSCDYGNGSGAVCDSKPHKLEAGAFDNNQNFQYPAEVSNVTFCGRH